MLLWTHVGRRRRCLTRKRVKGGGESVGFIITLYFNLLYIKMSYCVLSNVVIVSCQNCQLHVIDKQNLSQSMLIVLL